MTTMLLAKQNLPEGYIDCAVGEAHIVRDTLFKTFGINYLSGVCMTSFEDKSEYPPPNGYKPLVKFLEEKHQAPIIITNGAKQGLAATFYALRKMGKVNIGMRNPYWMLLPPLIEAAGLKFVDKNYDCYLGVLPNNPDNFMHSYDDAKMLADRYKDLGIPFIHDAAYYTPIYLPNFKEFGPIGDIQIYSLSKMYGLSGLRVGYIVCNNTDYYNLIQEYIEMTTVGVSAVSQDICFNLFCELAADEDAYNEFVKECQNLLYVAKSICKTIDKRILEVPDGIEKEPGMFLFAKLNKENAFKDAKVNVADGKYFGKESFIRMNLAVKTETLIEVVKRLNENV